MSSTRNHLLVTTNVAAKGNVTPCAGRLVDHLGNFNKPFINMENVELTWLLTGDTEEVNELVLPVDQVVAAHEYVDMSSDPHLAAMSEVQEVPNARVSMLNLPGLKLTGRMRGSALDWQRRFMVMQAPEVELLRDDEARLAATLQGLSYMLVNRDRMEAFFKTE